MAIKRAIGASRGFECASGLTEPSLHFRFGSAGVFAQGAKLNHHAVVRQAGLVVPIPERRQPIGHAPPERECGARVAGRFVVDRRARQQSALLEDSSRPLQRASAGIGQAEGHGARLLERGKALEFGPQLQLLSAIPRQSDRFAEPAFASQEVLQPLGRPRVVLFLRRGIE